MGIKYSLLLLILINPPSYRIVFQFSNAHKQPVAAKIRIYQNGELLREHQTNGAFEAYLPEGKYTVVAMRCDTVQNEIKSDRNKMVWMIVNDGCVQ